MKEISNMELIDLYKVVDDFIKFLEYSKIEKD
jgi:hypothetical protein